MNDNGYIYLRAAQFFLDGGLDAARTVFHLPFFPIMIASVSTITGLSLENASYLLNSLLLAVMAVAFGKIVSELTTDRRVLIAAVILLLAHPKLNDNYRASIIRDPGYWAFYLLAILSYLRFWKRPRLQEALGWGCAMIAATLFRYEGVVFLLCAPFFLFLRSNTSTKNKLRQFCKLNIIPVSLVSMALIWGVTTEHRGLLDFAQLNVLTGWISNIVPNLHHILLDRADLLSDALFYDFSYSQGYALSSVVITLLLIFLTETASSLTYIYTPFSLHAIARRIFPRNNGISVIAGFVAINVAVLLVYLTRYLFVTGRYVIPLILLLLVFTAFSLVHIYEHWQIQRVVSWRWRWAGRFFIIIFLLTALDGFISTSPSKGYIREAGYWLHDNMPDTAKVYTNNSGILYYSGKVREDLQKYAVTIDNIDNLLSSSINNTVVALSIKRKNRVLNQWLSNWKGTPPIKEFKNNNDDKMVIFSTMNQRLDNKVQQ